MTDDEKALLIYMAQRSREGRPKMTLWELAQEMDWDADRTCAALESLKRRKLVRDVKHGGT